jgi:hypothetical protein
MVGSFTTVEAPKDDITKVTLPLLMPWSRMESGGVAPLTLNVLTRIGESGHHSAAVPFIPAE